MKNEPVDIGEIFREGTPIDKAVSEAVKDALMRHKKLGQSIVGWQDGRVVRIPPEEIEVDDKAEVRDDT